MIGLEDTSEKNWDTLCANMHIVLAVFYKPGDDWSEKMLAAVEKDIYHQIKEFEDTTVKKIDANANPGLVKRYGLTELPAFMMFHHGEPVTKLIKKIDAKNAKVDRIHEPYKTFGAEMVELVRYLHQPSKK